MIGTLKGGMDATEVDHALYLLWQASIARRDLVAANVYRDCLMHIGGDWASDGTMFTDDTSPEAPRGRDGLAVPKP